MKKSFIFILLVIPAYCYPADYSKENTCGPTTLYADMKGDGSKNVIVLVSEKSEERGGDCLIKSLTIYEKNKIVYEEKTTADGADELFENSEATTVVRFQKSAKEMFFSYKHGCSNCGSAEVFGFIKGKYQRLSFSSAYSGKVVDLEGDGNNEIVIDPHGYYGTMPKIYDYDPIKDEFIASGIKHARFFRELIKNCEAKILMYPESGYDCCIRTSNLEMIAGAAATLGDSSLFNEAKDRLSAVYVDYGKAYYFNNDFENAIHAYKNAIENDSRNYKAFNFLGYSYFRNREIKEAIDSLESSVAINPSYTEGHYNLALAYWSDGKKTKAINEIKSVLKLDPNYKSKIKDDDQFKVFNRSKEFRTLIMN